MSDLSFLMPPPDGGQPTGGLLSGNMPMALLAGLLEFSNGMRGGRPGSGLQTIQGLLSGQQKEAEASGRKSAMATLAGGLDPKTGITWNSGRAGLDDGQKMSLLAQAMPDKFAELQLERAFPKPKTPIAVGDALVDPTTFKELYRAPSPFDFGGRPGATPQAADQQQAPTALPADHSMLIDMAEEKYGLPPGSMRSLVQAESGGNPGIVSPKGAVGLTQLMPGTARDLGVNNPRDPAQSIDGGARYLKQQMDAFGGNLDHALVAYNWGPGNAKMWVQSGADPARLPAETRAYLPKVRGGMGDQPEAPQPAAGEWVRGVNRKTGQALDLEQNTVTGQTRPYQKPPEGFQWAADGKLEAIPGGPKDEGKKGLFSGASVEGQALNHLVESGLLTKEQAITWAAGKTATGPNGQLDFITPRSAPTGGGSAGNAPGAPAISSVRAGQMATQDKEAIMEADKAAESAAGAVASLEDALKINNKARGGVLAPIAQGLSRTGYFYQESGPATTELENIVGTQALGQLKAIFGGNPTEGERKIMLDLQGSVSKSAAERELIFNRALAASKARLQREQNRAKALRAGTYYTDGMPQTTPDQQQQQQQQPSRVLRFDAQGNLIQ